MPALPARARATMRQWITRAISGYWTHAGYMNWDSGLGFKRWHQGKKLGLTQEALSASPPRTRCCPARSGAGGRRRCSTAASASTTGWLRARGGLPDPVLFNVTEVPQGPSSAWLRRRAHPGQRRPRDRRRPRPQGRRRAAAAVLLRPRHRPPGRDHADLQHRDRRRQPARVPVRRARPRAAVRRPAGGGGEHRRARRRPPSACSCATSAAGAWRASQVGRARGRAAACGRCG